MNSSTPLVIGAAGLLAATRLLAVTNLYVAADVVVTAPTPHADILRGASPAAALDSLPGLAVVSQGVADGQSDLQIQGSSFSGAGLSVAGLALGNPQTEHFNAELPIDPFLFAPPTVLAGFDQQLVSDGFLVGSVALDFAPLSQQSSYLSIGGDEESGAWVSGALSLHDDAADPSRAATLFGASRNVPDIDNLGNDLDSWRAGALLQGEVEAGALDLVLAHAEKEFGAMGYYGVNPEWPAREQTRDTLVLGRFSRVSSAGGSGHVAASWRRFHDDYQLDLPSGDLYRNEHRTDTLSVSVDDNQPVYGDAIWLKWRASAVSERIRSSSLGDHERARYSGMLLPHVELGSWHLSAGSSAIVFENSEALLPLAQAVYQLSEDWEVSLAYAESEREPSYTELNYESPASLGNAGLRNQKARTTTLALTATPSHALSLRGSVFHRDESDAVDWVRETAESTRWVASNLDDITALGADLNVDWQPADMLRAGLWLQGLDKDADAAPYASRYALDYAEFLAQVNLLWRVVPRVELELVQQYRRQAANPLRTDRDGLLGRAAIHFLLPLPLAPRLTLDVTNPWDDDLALFPGQDTYAPRRVSASLSAAW